MGCGTAIQDNTADTNDWGHERLEQDGIYRCGKWTILWQNPAKKESSKKKISFILPCPA